MLNVFLNSTLSEQEKKQKKYLKNWSQIIGYPGKNSKTEHWSRVKALTKRLDYFGIDYYDYELMPLADFAQEIREQLNKSMIKDYLEGKMEGFAYCLDLPYELEQWYKKMHREAYSKTIQLHQEDRTRRILLKTSHPKQDG